MGRRGGGSELPLVLQLHWKPVYNMTWFLRGTTGTQVTPNTASEEQMWVKGEKRGRRMEDKRERARETGNWPLVWKRVPKHLSEHAKIPVGESDPGPCVHTRPVAWTYLQPKTPARRSSVSCIMDAETEPTDRCCKFLHLVVPSFRSSSP